MAAIVKGIIVCLGVLFVNSDEVHANPLNINIPKEAQTKVNAQKVEPARRKTHKNHKSRVNNQENNFKGLPVQEKKILRQQIVDAPRIKNNCDHQRKICVRHKIYNEKAEILVISKTYETRTVHLQAWLNNAKADFELDHKNIVVKPSEEKRVGMLYKKRENEPFTYSINFNSSFGHFDAVHDNSYVYTLPFNPGESYKMIQGFGGKFSHKSKSNYYAYDFKMPVGTPILAAREGTVVKVVEKHGRGGINRSFNGQDNYIYIEHADGTIGVYSHLVRGGAIVRTGDKVQVSQQIGYSGDSGYSNTPHLHFAVIKYIAGGRVRSIPIRVQTSEGIKSRLREMRYYMR